MLKIGLTGPIGSGKSYVSNILRAKGYSVYDSDSAAKRLVESSERVRVAVVKLLGEGAYDGQGAYQRSWVAAKVFSDRALLEGLNAIVHPAVFADFAAWALLRQREGARIVFFESALLPSVRRDYLQAMDYVVCVRASAECRTRRVMARSGMAREKVLSYMANQPDASAFESLANFTVRNEGEDDLEEQIDGLINRLQQL